MNFGTENLIPETNLSELVDKVVGMIYIFNQKYSYFDSFIYVQFIILIFEMYLDRDQRIFVLIRYKILLK